ncbi:DUF4097 family beta strand repeat-containing protein [Streptomyces beihaiensis]|uniref:DUF4097 domain-containing protein n=1 Tax=Streptomyces beihaiensis TaxID=2984495 RepID=A0ABT3TT66_9ACTN|nr:DUF4097 family beta strand repeat-containing protein [Streptomyces beihaiensis]MCX3060221.1 DUF4097 domain-containing protein [Streptomyces beihaiensis]
MQKFDTPTTVTAVLDIPAGRVRFIAADRADTTVEVLPANPAKSRDAKAAEEIQVGYADGVLRIAAPAAKNSLLGHSGAVEVTVQLPAGSRVEGRSGAAELRVVGRLGHVSFEGAHGAVKIDEAAGLNLAAYEGVTVGRLTGDGVISTHKGDITVDEAGAGALTLTTQSGDITVTAAHGVCASLDAGTSYGRVANALKNDGTPALRIRATTSHGDITARGL